MSYFTEPLDVDYLQVVSNGLNGKFGDNERAWCIIPTIVISVCEKNKVIGEGLKYKISEQSENPFVLIHEAIEEVGKEKFDAWAQDISDKFKSINKNPYVDSVGYYEL